MRHFVLFFLLTLAGLLCFMGYCYALVDWVQDYKTGVYTRNGTEAIVETFAIIAYTYLAVRFARSKISIQ